MHDRPLPPVRKSLGQHFLTDPRILQRIVDALELTGAETVVEIGAGRGALTDLLAPRAGRVVAIEYDRALAALLRDRYASVPNVAIVEADVLRVDLGAVAGGDFLIAGNVPYYITTPILFRALEPPRARRAVYLVQKEVADRVVAPAGSREYGALSVNVQALARAERLFRIPAGAFQPPPKVDSAAIRIVPLRVPLVAANDEEAFRVMVQAAFGMRRKQMRRVARSLFHLGATEAERLLARAGIEPEARPETLTPEHFARLAGERRKDSKSGSERGAGTK